MDYACEDLKQWFALGILFHGENLSSDRGHTPYKPGPRFTASGAKFPILVDSRQ